MSEAKEELKTCPFCGGTAEIVPVSNEENGFFGECVICSRCGCGTLASDDEAEVIFNWNSRI